MRVLPTRWQQKPAGIDSRYGTKLRHCHLMYKSSGKVDRRIRWHYSTTLLLYFAFALVHDSRGIEIVSFTISLALSAGTLNVTLCMQY